MTQPGAATPPDAFVADGLGKSFGSLAALNDV